MPLSRTPVIAALSVFTATLALTACVSASKSQANTSSSTGKSGTAGVASACELLTTGEIVAATKSSFGPGKLEKTQDTPYGKYTSCVWQEKAHPLNAVRVSMWTAASGFEAAKQTAGEVKDYPGLGEKAFTAPFASVYVLANGKTFFAQYYSPDGSDEEHLPISESLAKTASARL